MNILHIIHQKCIVFGFFIASLFLCVISVVISCFLSCGMLSKSSCRHNLPKSSTTSKPLGLKEYISSFGLRHDKLFGLSVLTYNVLNNALTLLRFSCLAFYPPWFSQGPLGTTQPVAKLAVGWLSISFLLSLLFRELPLHESSFLSHCSTSCLKLVATLLQ